MTKLGVVRLVLVRLNLFIHASYCHICTWIFYRVLPLKALLVYADCMTISGTHRTILSQRSIKIMVRCTQEAVLLCYWWQSLAWLHTLTEQPNFWTRAIRMWSHKSSHRANQKLWLRALIVLAYVVRVGAGRFFREHHNAQYTRANKVLWGNSPKYFWLIPGRRGSHRANFSASAHTIIATLGLFCTIHSVFSWTLRHGSILCTILPLCIALSLFSLISFNHLYTLDTYPGHKAGVWHKGHICSKGGRCLCRSFLL